MPAFSVHTARINSRQTWKVTREGQDLQIQRHSLRIIGDILDGCFLHVERGDTSQEYSRDKSLCPGWIQTGGREGFRKTGDEKYQMCMNCRLHSYVQEDGETITAGMDYREGEKWGGNNEKYGLRSLYIPEGIFIHIFHTFTFEGWSWSSYNSGLTEAVIAGVNKLTIKLWHVAASHVFPAWTQCYLWPAIKCYCTEYPNCWVSGGDWFDLQRWQRGDPSQSLTPNEIKA